MAGKHHLQGWKEIAAWLGRDERTAKRWEKQRGLPVRRVPGSGRANVFCLVPELEAWLTHAATDPDPETPALPAPHDPAPVAPEPLPLTLDAPDLSPVEPAAPTQAALVLADQTPDLGRPAPLSTTPSIIAPARAGRPLHLSRFAVPLAAILLLTFALLSAHPLHRAAPVRAHVAASSPAAHELTLQGSYLLEQRNPASLAQAHAAFENALRLDPSSAEANAGLAYTFLLLREYSNLPQAVAYQRAEQAATRALALNPDLADAHTALGFIDFFFHWRPADAEQQFRAALVLDPHCATAHHWYGSMLLHQARYEDSLVQLNQARALQPASPAILATTALALGLAGHRDAALSLAHTTLLYQPENASMHRALALISLVGPRDIPTYLAEMRRFATIAHDPSTLSLLDAGDAAFRTGGEPALWRAMLRHDERAGPAQTNVRRASFKAAAGDTTSALDDLTLLAGLRDPDMIGIAMDPLLLDLRRSGRLRDVAQRMNLTLAADRQLLASSERKPLPH